MNLEIHEIQFGSPDYQREVALRQLVLRDPLGLRFSAEDLAKENSDVHFAAFSDGKLVGCLLLSPVSPTALKMRQVAVDPGSQGLGIGRRLVEACEAFSRAKGVNEIVLNAREGAVAFYLGLGYMVIDGPFTEVTVPHMRMRKVLS